MQTFYTNVWILHLGQLLLSWKMLQHCNIGLVLEFFQMMGFYWKRIRILLYRYLLEEKIFSFAIFYNEVSYAHSFCKIFPSMEIFLGWYADWIMENICRLIHNTIRFFLGSKKKTRLWKGAKTCWRISKASDSIRNENFGNFFPILLRFALVFWKIWNWIML